MKIKNWSNEVLSSIGTILGIDIITTKEVLGIVLIVVNIIVLIVSLMLKLITWYKEAKKDGKITEDEINEAIDIVNSGIEDIKEKGESNSHKEKGE